MAVIASWALLSVLQIAQAEPLADLDDAANRMQYSFYTRDVRGLRDALGAAQAVEAPELLVPIKEYDLSYGHWKLAQLLGAATATGDKSSKSEAARSAEQCRSGLDALIEKNDHNAELFALRAVCDQLAQRLGMLRGVLNSNCEANKSLRKAVEIAPRNPRVLLVQALCVAERGDRPNPVAAQAMRKAVAAFDEHNISQPGAPDWGHAEALFELGRLTFNHGDRIGARNALEQALVLAPDYVAAATLLKQVAATR